jgi:ribosomal protein L11 methyltransferase
VDHDPQALEAAQANALRNGVAARLLACPPEAIPDANADILVANILAGALIELAPRLGALTRPGGRLALSGILPEQADKVATAYRGDFDLDDPTFRDEWALIGGRRRPP